MTKSSKKRLVVLDDDMDLLDELAAHFADTFEVDTFPGTPAALKALRDAPPDALTCSIVTPDGRTLERARKLGLDTAAFLARNDSYHFFDAVGGLIKTGPTNTNVMDIRLLLVG